MKKLILGIVLAGFVAFGTFVIHSAVAADDNTEVVSLSQDNDPVKKADAQATPDGKDKKECTNCKKECKSSTNCKDGQAQCKSKEKCCPSKSKECKKEDGDKK